MPRFSIIVPVYNVEKVVSRCIESILNQSIADFELILVDDGSEDTSGILCDEYATKDQRIYVVHQENRGVSHARNTGLEIAKGKSIVFIDSDDYIEKEYLKAFCETEADMIVSGYKISGYDLNEIIIRNYGAKHVLRLDEERYAELYEKGMLNYVWAKCFRANLIIENKIYFDEELQVSEDTAFVAQYTAHCKTVSIIDSTGYNYIKYHHGTLTSVLQAIDTINCLDKGANAVFYALKAYLGEKAEHLVVNRIGPLYRDLLPKFIEQGNCNAQMVYTLFRKKWFRLSLDHVDDIYADEDPKYRALLKTKSPTLFCLYRAYVRLRNR